MGSAFAEVSRYPFVKYQVQLKVRALEQLVEFFMIEIHPRAGQLQTTVAQGQADLEDA